MSVGLDGLLEFLRLDGHDLDLAVLRHARVLQSLVDRLVGVADRDVLADERYAAALLRLCRLPDESVPHRVLHGPDVEVKLVQHLFVKALEAQLAGDCVHAVRDVLLLYHALAPDVAEHGELLLVLLGYGHLRAADEDVRDYADVAEHSDGML